MTGETLFRRVQRYITVGVICAVTQNLIVIGGGFVGLYYFPATLVSVAVVIPLGYFLHCRYTFDQPRKLDSFVRFASGFVLAYPFYLALIAMFCTGLRWPVAIAAPVTTAILFLFNYVWAHWAIVQRFRSYPKRSPLQLH